jgi:hypothetical protein
MPDVPATPAVTPHQNDATFPLNDAVMTPDDAPVDRARDSGSVGEVFNDKDLRDLRQRHYAAVKGEAEVIVLTPRELEMLLFAAAQFQELQAEIALLKTVNRQIRQSVLAYYKAMGQVIVDLSEGLDRTPHGDFDA